jgi:flagellar biosynthesis/type III secretory pathway M-ring protein FliF/YscJ
MLGVIKLIFAGVGIVALVAFVLVPLWRMLRTKPDLDRIIPDYTLLDEEEEEELQIPVGRQKPDRTQLLNMARSDPRKTAMILSRWLRDRK